jgi:hypothetical protein
MMTGKLLVFASILTVMGVSDCLADPRCSAISPPTKTYKGACGLPNDNGPPTPWITNQPVILVGGEARCRDKTGLNYWVEVRDGSWAQSFMSGWVKRNLLKCEGSSF